MAEFPRWRDASVLPECDRPYIGVAPDARHGIVIWNRPQYPGTTHTYPLRGIKKWMYLDEAIGVLDTITSYKKGMDLAMFRLHDILNTNGVPDKERIRNDMKQIYWFMFGKKEGLTSYCMKIYDTWRPRRNRNKGDGNDTN